MKKTQEIINQAFKQYRPALAFSGGGDSMVLLDIVYNMGYRPPLIYAESQMEYTETLAHIEAQAARYGLKLHIARAGITPINCWLKYGYPMLGKQSAREWMQTHKSNFGFKIDVSTCCRKMKIEPARHLIKKLGCNATLTGQRGGQDDRLRGLREQKDGYICYLKTDKLTQINPLLGWTDCMIRRYQQNHKLPAHPLKNKGLITTGCIYCGGGAQFDNSGFRILRRTNPTAWRTMIKDYKFGEIIISIKYDRPLEIARAAIDRAGGLDRLMDNRPWIFDFIRKTPLAGYSR